MKNAIKNYFKKISRECPDYYNTEDFSSLEKEIKKNFKCGTIPLQRQEKTDISPFEKEFGFRLPIEIVQYINLFWHSYICGYVDDSECIILFSVLKREGDSSDDILFYENGLIDMARDWAEIGDIKKYIPIGWLGYSGTYVLYEIKTGNIFLEDKNADVDGKIESKPIANSMSGLINSLNIKK